MAQTPTSTSATVNNAAKDDVLTSYTFTLADLLANDPGGAMKYSSTISFSSTDGTVVNNGDGTYTYVGPEDGGFSYTIQIAKGTFSTADVTFDVPCEPTVGVNLFSDSFEYGAPLGGYVVTPLTLWGGESGEVVGDGYQSITGTQDGAYTLQARTGSTRRTAPAVSTSAPP